MYVYVYVLTASLRCEI